MPMPQINLVDDQNKPFTWPGTASSLYIVYFYPKDMTSGCTRQASDFASAYSELLVQDAHVIGISPDSVSRHQKFKQQYQLPFPLLVDDTHQCATDYDVWKEKTMYGKKYFGIVRTTFLLNASRELIHRWDNVKVEGHVEEVSNFIKDYRQKTSSS